jgi:hypothetical protein
VQPVLTDLRRLSFFSVDLRATTAVFVVVHLRALLLLLLVPLCWLWFVVGLAVVVRQCGSIYYG